MNAEVMGEGWERTYDRRGTQGGWYLIVMGAVKLCCEVLLKLGVDAHLARVTVGD
jgi:hypothetical protein